MAGKAWKAIVAALLLGAWLGCPLGATRAFAEDVTITWWINPWRIRPPGMPADQAPEAEDFPAWLAEQFEASHPGVDVAWEVVTNAGYQEKLAAAIAAGSPPDITRPVGNFPQWVAWGLLEPIDPYLTAADRSDFYDYALAEGEIGGKHYIWPWNNSDSGKGSAFLADVRVFESRGLSIPEVVPADYWTVDAFVDTLKKLTWDEGGDGTPDHYGIALTARGDPPINVAWMFIFGGQLVDADARRFVANQPKSVAGITFARDLITKHHVAPPGAEGMGIYDVINLFHQHKVALGYGGPYEIGRIHRYYLSGQLSEEFPVRLLPNPHVPSVGPVAFHTTGGFVVFKQRDPEKKELVMEFARYLTSPEIGKLLESLYYLSARKSANAVMYQTLPQIAAEIDAYLRFIEHGKEYFGPPQLSTAPADKYLQAMWEAVFAGSKTPQAAADEFVRQANRVVF
ncbi:MAG TPA: extracellular solute-binding protein [Limnochordia bacterium]